MRVNACTPYLNGAVFCVTDWLAHIDTFNLSVDKPLLTAAVTLAQEQGSPLYEQTTLECFMVGLEMADVLMTLRMDTHAIAGALLFPILSQTTDKTGQERISQPILALVQGACKMSANDLLGQHEKQHTQQLDNLRKMLMAMIQDARIILIKLAEQLVLLRHAQALSVDSQKQLALAARDIYAPLANRLGVGQIKWELEDYAFRYLCSETYRQIAALLDERRVDREQYLQSVITELSTEIERVGLCAHVQGRVKHIYSIWRKMQRKNAAFCDIYDVRALRILVETTTECYSALGLVHSLWQYIPKEFDDYITSPKENGYRSLHTAVIGPAGKVIEVQIRTHQMHQDSEIGVAAHWRYKEGIAEPTQYEQKIAWLRELLAWQESVVDARALVEDIKSDSRDQRIYVLTPKGDVLDLPVGATPLDFAYKLHTDVGHHCGGAKVDGRIVPLNQSLDTGQTIEILRTRQTGPSRDWLNPALGYIITPRARNKIQSWFKHLHRDERITQGRQLLDKALQKMGISHLPLESLAARFGVSSADDVLAGLASGDIRLQQVLHTAQATQSLDPLPIKAQPTKQTRASPDNLTLCGVGDLMTQLARCCHPLPGDPVLGYVSQGRGVIVHRADCSNVLALSETRGERIVHVSWSPTEARYPVCVEVVAFDRRALLRDITVLLSEQPITLNQLTTQQFEHQSRVRVMLSIEVSDLEHLSQLLDKLADLPNIFSVRRQA